MSGGRGVHVTHMGARRARLGYMLKEQDANVDLGRSFYGSGVSCWALDCIWFGEKL